MEIFQRGLSLIPVGLDMTNMQWWLVFKAKLRAGEPGEVVQDITVLIKRGGIPESLTTPISIDVRNINFQCNQNANGF